MDNALFLREAGFQYDAATLDFAVNLFGVVGQADALDLSTSFDNHRRASHLQILDNGHRIAIQQLGAIAILRHIVGCWSALLAIKLVCTIGTNIQRAIKIDILATTLRTLCNLTHKSFRFLSLLLYLTPQR